MMTRLTGPQGPANLLLLMLTIVKQQLRAAKHNLENLVAWGGGRGGPRGRPEAAGVAASLQAHREAESRKPC